MLLVRKGYDEDIEEEYLFTDKDRSLAVKQAEVFLSEKGDDIYSCFKDGKLYGDVNELGRNTMHPRTETRKGRMRLS